MRLPTKKSCGIKCTASNRDRPPLIRSTASYNECTLLTTCRHRLFLSHESLGKNVIGCRYAPSLPRYSAAINTRCKIGSPTNERALECDSCRGGELRNK